MRCAWPPASSISAATAEARLAAEAFFRARIFVDGWLAHADPRSGLIPRNLQQSTEFWNAADAAAVEPALDRPVVRRAQELDEVDLDVPLVNAHALQAAVAQPPGVSMTSTSPWMSCTSPRASVSWMPDIRAAGHLSLRAIAAELNARGMLTRRGGRWHVSTVTNLLDRLGLAEYFAMEAYVVD